MTTTDDELETAIFNEVLESSSPDSREATYIIRTLIRVETEVDDLKAKVDALLQERVTRGRSERLFRWLGILLIVGLYIFK